MARSWKSILCELQEVVGCKNDDYSHVKANLTILTYLLKKIKGCENKDKNDLTDWFQVDKKEKGFKKR